MWTRLWVAEQCRFRLKKLASRLTDTWTPQEQCVYLQRSAVLYFTVTLLDSETSEQFVSSKTLPTSPLILINTVNISFWFIWCNHSNTWRVNRSIIWRQSDLWPAPPPPCACEETPPALLSVAPAERPCSSYTFLTHLMIDWHHAVPFHRWTTPASPTPSSFSAVLYLKWTDAL